LNQFGSFNRIIFWLWYSKTICFGGNGGFLFDSFFSEELISPGKWQSIEKDKTNKNIKPNQS
jgi:hypothetical protein